MSRACNKPPRPRRSEDVAELEVEGGHTLTITGLAKLARAKVARLVMMLELLFAEPEAIDFLELELRQGESVGIIGVSQYGKSKVAKEKAARLRDRRKRVLAWDPCREWGKAGQAIEREETPPGPLEHTVTVDELEENPELLLDPELSLAVCPTDIFADRKTIAEEFRRFIYIVRTTNVGHELHLFVDEVGILREHCEEQLDDLVERGGKDGIRPYLIGQRWVHFGTNQRAEFAYLVAFAQHKISDLRFLAIDVGRPFAAAICVQEPHEYRVAYLRRVHADALASVSQPQREQDDG